MYTGIRILIVLATAVFIVGCSKPVSFSKNIKPILVANCLSCHDGSGEGSSTSGFNVQTYTSVMKGTKFGSVVVPGSSESSTLFRLISHQVDPKIQMPPHHDEAQAEGRSEPLTERQIEYFRNWIDQGAKDN